MTQERRRLIRTRAQPRRGKRTEPDTPVQERCGLSGTSLTLSAIRPSSGSEPAFIFCIARLRCTFTVPSAMPISWPICLLKAAAASRPEGAIELACDLKGGLQEGRRQYWCRRRFDRA
jgi:hypothetical protein